MTRFLKEEWVNDEVMGKLWQVIREMHKPGGHTQKVLWDNRRTEDFCEEASHFAVMGGGEPIYLHYEVSSWLKTRNGISVRIDAVVIYDSFEEYNSARLKGLHSTTHQDGINLN